MHRRPASRAGRRLLGAATWCLLLGGLFAMHGLGDHGAAHHEIGNAAVTAASTIGHTTHSPARPAQPTASEATSEPAATSHEQSNGSGMAALCMAVLAGALIALLLWRAGHTVVSTLRRRLVGNRVPLAVLRERDPPSLFALSIQRC